MFSLLGARTCLASTYRRFHLTSEVFDKYPLIEVTKHMFDLTASGYSPPTRVLADWDPCTIALLLFSIQLTS